MTDTELKALISRSLNARIDLFGDLLNEEREAALFFDPLADMIAPRVPYFLRPILAVAEDGIDDEEFEKQSAEIEKKIREGLEEEIPSYARFLLGDKIEKVATAASKIVMIFAQRGAALGLED